MTFDEVASTGSIMGSEQEVNADTIVSAGRLGTASRLKSVMIHSLRPLSSEYGRYEIGETRSWPEIFRFFSGKGIRV